MWIVLAYLLAITTLIVGAGRLATSPAAAGCCWPGSSVHGGVGPVRRRAHAWAADAARAAQASARPIMMALTMAFVGETVRNNRPAAPWGCSERCPADRHRPWSIARRRADRRTGWRAIFLVNLPLGT